MRGTDSLLLGARSIVRFLEGALPSRLCWGLDQRSYQREEWTTLKDVMKLLVNGELAIKVDSTGKDKAGAFEAKQRKKDSLEKATCKHCQGTPQKWGLLVHSSRQSSWLPQGEIPHRGCYNDVKNGSTIESLHEENSYSDLYEKTDNLNFASYHCWSNCAKSSAQNCAKSFANSYRRKQSCKTKRTSLNSIKPWRNNTTRST